MAGFPLAEQGKIITERVPTVNACSDRKRTLC
jgi:hypothetical protein